MKILVLGNTGMLGRYVSKYFRTEGYRVVNLNRDQVDAHSFNEFTLREFKLEEGDVFINCIGIIPQREKVNDGIYLSVNSAFPHLMSDYCNKNKYKFIHVTTDCVFTGNDGNYSEDSIHDEEGIYGKSKSLGEPQNATVMRTSIIGEEEFNKKSLLEWVKSNSNKNINGYTNHIWNGVTCLQFAKICRYVIDNNLYWEGVKHFYSPETVSKFEIIKMISDVYDLNITVTPVSTETKCDKSLTSVRDDIHIEIPSLRSQIEELTTFKLGE